MHELNALVANFDDTQLEVLAVIAVEIATVKASRFTGKTVIELNSNQGGMGDPEVTQRKKIRLRGTKKRSIRSSL